MELFRNAVSFFLFQKVTYWPNFYICIVLLAANYYAFALNILYYLNIKSNKHLARPNHLY